MDAALEEESLANDEGDWKQYSDEAYDSPDQEIRPDVEHGRVVIVVHLGRALECAGRQARHVPSPGVSVADFRRARLRPAATRAGSARRRSHESESARARLIHITTCPCGHPARNDLRR